MSTFPATFSSYASHSNSTSRPQYFSPSEPTVSDLEPPSFPIGHVPNTNGHVPVASENACLSADYLAQCRAFLMPIDTDEPENTHTHSTCTPETSLPSASPTSTHTHTHPTSSPATHTPEYLCDAQPIDQEERARYATFLENSTVVPASDRRTSDAKTSPPMCNNGWEEVHPNWLFHPIASVLYNRQRALFLHRESNTWWSWNAETSNYKRVFLGTAERPPLDELAGLDLVLTGDEELRNTMSNVSVANHFAAPVTLHADGTIGIGADGMRAHSAPQKKTGPFGVCAVLQGGGEGMEKELMQIEREWSQRLTETYVSSQYGRDILLVTDFLRRCETNKCYALPKHSEKECAICYGCLNENAHEELSVRLDCKHVFHLGCMEDWAHKGNSVPVSCPVCRSQVTSWSKIAWI